MNANQIIVKKNLNKYKNFMGGWKVISRDNVEYAKRSARNVADTIMAEWETRGRKLCISEAKRLGLNEFYVTTAIVQRRITPEQYKILTKQKRVPSVDVLTVMIPKHIVTSTNTFPLANTIRRKININRRTEELIHIIPRMGREHNFAAGGLYANEHIHKSSESFKWHLKNNAYTKADLTDEIEKTKTSLDNNL